MTVIAHMLGQLAGFVHDGGQGMRKATQHSWMAFSTRSLF
jgi:hypothetical protein